MPKSVYVFDGWRLDTGRRQLLSPSGVEVRLTSPHFSVRLNGAVHQWREDPPRKLSVGPGS